MRIKTSDLKEKVCKRCQQLLPIDKFNTPYTHNCLICNKERKSEHNKKHYKPEKDRLRARAWYRNNRLKAQSLQREWRDANPDRLVKYTEGRKQLMRMKPNQMPKNYWAMLLHFYDYRCCKCGTDEDLQHDHVIPLSWFCGTHTLENSQVLCRRCNASKHNSSRADYRNGRILTADFYSKSEIDLIFQQQNQARRKIQQGN